jgi:hypothetical protein
MYGGSVGKITNLFGFEAMVLPPATIILKIMPLPLCPSVANLLTL